MLEMISVNQLKNWRRCKKKFYFDRVKKLRWPTETRHFQFGREIHKLLEYQSQGLPVAHLLADARPNVRQAWDRLMAHPTTHLPVIASEWGFQVPLAGHWLAGRIDRIARHGDEIWIIDWKTGTAVPKTPELDWQTVVYLFAVHEAAEDLGLGRIAPEQLRFVYVEVKETVRDIIIPYDAETHAAHRQLLADTLAALQRETAYPLPDVCPDRHCAYRPICGIDARNPQN